MKHRMIFLMIVLCMNHVQASFERTESGARPLCLGGAYVGLADDAWGIFYNPAGLAQARFAELAVFYSPQPFGVPELKSLSFAALYPSAIGSFGLSVRRYGFELYRETSGSLAYAHKLAGIFVGINVNYHSVSIAHYGSAGTIGVDLGVLVPILDNLRWGLAAKNINAPTIGQSAERLPQAFTTGIFYKPIESFCFVFDYQKELSFPAAPRFGFEYWIIDGVALRGGASDQPATYAAGLGIRYGFFQIDYAFTTHQELGLTHQASLSLRTDF